MVGESYQSALEGVSNLENIPLSIPSEMANNKDNGREEREQLARQWWLDQWGKSSEFRRENLTEFE